MKHISKLALTLLMISGIFMGCFLPVCEAAFVNGGTQKYMYNGVIITSVTYNCESDTAGSTSLSWTIYDESKKARDWPSTVVVEGNIVYDSHRTGTKLCRLTVGNSYDIRVVFVHSANQDPYYYLMIEGEGVTGTGLSGSYTDSVWISAVRNSLSSKITKTDGIEGTYGSFSLDHVIVTDNDENPDKYYNNHADFRNIVYSDGALHIDLLWTPKPESVTAENISVLNDDSEIAIDKFVCEGNTISLYSNELTRGETYVVSIHDTMRTALDAEIRIPLKTQYTVPNSDADILSGVFSDSSFALTAQNLTGDDFDFTVLIALKSDDGTVQEVIVTDNYTVAPNTSVQEFVIENLDFKSLIPEAYIVKSALLPVPVSDRSYKN